MDGETLAESTCSLPYVLGTLWQQTWGTYSLEARHPCNHSNHSLFRFPFGISPVSMPWGRVMRHPRGLCSQNTKCGPKEESDISIYPCSWLEKKTCLTLLTTRNLTLTSSNTGRYVVLIRPFSRLTIIFFWIEIFHRCRSLWSHANDEAGCFLRERSESLAYYFLLATTPNPILEIEDWRGYTSSVFTRHSRRCHVRLSKPQCNSEGDSCWWPVAYDPL